MPPVSRSAVQTTPARPSISPISTTTKPLKSSPIAARDVRMKNIVAVEHEEAIEFSESGEADAGDDLDNRSSSLSEPEDDNEGVEEDDIVEEDVMNGDDAAAHQLLDYDSEATTERLDQTPQKTRKHADSIGRTPSKLNQTSNPVDELSEPPSPLEMGAGAASSTSTIATAGQKRKRSGTADSSLTSADSDLAQSPRKKPHEMPLHAVEDEVEDALEHVEQSTENIEPVEDVPVAENVRETPVAPVKPTKGRKAKHWKTKRKEALQELERQATEDAMEATEEQIEEREAKTEEEIRAKKEASSNYEDVYKQFRFFRERMNAEQLATLTAELAQLEPANCTHPEYMKQVACVDARLKKQISEAFAYYRYKMKSIRERALGERTQLHSQYFQSVRERREVVLDNLGEDWYNIQKERRQSHETETDKAHIFHFNPDARAQKKMEAQRSLEVSIVSGVAKHVGWPAAPEIQGVTNNIEDDLRAMGISKRIPPPVVPSRAPGPSVMNQHTDERLAQQRFLESTPWANPPHQAASHPLGAVYTENWASSGRNLLRTLSGQVQQQTLSTLSTPIAQNRAPMEHPPSTGTIPMNSDGPEGTSSIIAAPPTSSRVDMIHQASSNHTSPITLPKHRNILDSGPRLTGFRDISGASTIDMSQEAEQRDAAKAGLANLTQVSSDSHSTFDTSQFHRHHRDERDAYPNAGFRPQEGAFGTPAPLPPRDGAL